MVTSLLLALAATDLPLELVNGGLAFSGKYYLQASFDGHPERCLLDTGATGSEVSDRAFASYPLARKGGQKGAANQLTGTDMIRVREAAVGSARFTAVLVTRAKAGLVGADLVASRPFSFQNLPRPALSWKLPARPLAEHQLRRYRGILALPVTFDAHPAQALWDTGAELSCVAPEVIARHPAAFTFVQDIDQGKDGTGRPVVMKLYRADKLVVGSQTFRNLTMLAFDFGVVHQHLSKDVDFILGVNAIRQANWSFDPAHAAWDVTRESQKAQL